MKSCPRSLLIGEMQIKDTMRYHYTLTMVATKQDSHSGCSQGREESGTFMYYWWESRMAQSLCKTALASFRKFNRNLSEEPSTPLLGI